MQWLILWFVFLFTFVFIFWLSRYLEMRRHRIKKRVDEIEKKEWQEEEFTLPKEKSSGKLSLVSLLWRILSRIKLVRKLEERMHSELKKANILMKPSELIVMIFLSGLMGSVLGVFVTDFHLERGIWLGLITWIFPLMWLKAKKNKRKVALEAQLPEMINMTANSLKAGYSLIQAFELLSREMPPPLSEEIQRLLQEMRLGVNTEQALIHFNSRVDSKDLDLIITAMLIQRQVGGNLAEILDTIGETIRERIRIQGEIKSLTAQGRMSMAIFMLLPIGLGGFLMMSNPDYIMVLFTEPLGWLMLTMAFFGQLIGAIIIRKIIQIEV